jgi:hypothetical protein
MQLTVQQRRFFDRFGYLVIRGLFDAREVANVSDAFEKTMALCGVDRLPEHARRGILGPIQHLPQMSALLDHPRIVGLAEGVFGGEFNYACGDGSYYTGDTQWHPDGNWGRLFACKILFYLDPLTRSTGALRVIPGSHDPAHPLRQVSAKDGRAGIVREMEETGIENGADYPGAEAVETEPGDVIIFNHDLFHASFGGGKRRRMFTMNLTRRCESPEDLARLREYVSVHSPGGYKLPIGGMHFRPIHDTAGPARARRLEQCSRMHDEIFPQLVGRQTHGEQIANMMRVLHPEAQPALA